MVRMGRSDGAGFERAQAVADQDMVDRPFRAPAGEGGHQAAGRLQPGLAVQHLHFRALGLAVEIAHQHRVGVVGHQVGDEIQLRQARTHAQRQVRDGDRQPFAAVAEARQQHAASADAAGQGVILHFHRFQPAEQAIGAGRDPAHAPVGLVAPVVEAGALGQVVGLVGETRAQAAGVGLLQADDVAAAGEPGDRIQAGALAARRQRVRPAAGHVVAVAARAGAGLDVGREQAQGVGGGIHGGGTRASCRRGP